VLLSNGLQLLLLNPSPCTGNSGPGAINPCTITIYRCPNGISHVSTHHGTSFGCPNNGTDPSTYNHSYNSCTKCGSD